MKTLQRLAALHRAIEEAADLAPILRSIPETVVEVAGSGTVGLWLEHDRQLHLVGSAGDAVELLPAVEIVGEGAIGTMFASHAVAHPDRSAPDVCWTSATMTVRGKPVGTIATRALRPSTDDELRTLRTVARAVGRRIEGELEDRLKPAGSSAVMGREPYLGRLGEELERSLSGNYPLSLAIVRVHGYLDAALLRRVNDLVRSVDECFSTDLGEFAIVMPHTPAEHAAVAARRVGGVILKESGSGVSVSVGVAESASGDPHQLDSEARQAVVLLGRAATPKSAA